VRYAVKVADLRVNTPPNTDSAKFLTDVRLLGKSPETVLSKAATVRRTSMPWCS